MTVSAYRASVRDSSHTRHSRHPVSERFTPSPVRHEVVADTVVISKDGHRVVLTEAEAARICWAVLADIRPDDVIPVPECVSYQELNRLKVLEVVAKAAPGGVATSTIAEKLNWTLRTAQRRATELEQDGRLTATFEGSTGKTTHRRGYRTLYHLTSPEK